MSEALAVQETLGLGMLPSAMMRTTGWRARTSSSLYPGRRLIWVCGRRGDCPAAEFGANEKRASWTKENEGAVARDTGAIERSFFLATSCARGGG